MPKAGLFLICTILVELSSSVSNECSDKKPWLCRKGGELTGPLRKIRDEHLVLIDHPLRPVPEYFDARGKWPQCESIRKIYKEGTCITSWAFSVATTASDRLCIDSNGTNQFKFSVQDLITCCDDCYSHDEDEKTHCDGGGHLLEAGAHLIVEGCVSEECQPYNIEELENGCQEICVNKTTSYKDNKRKTKFVRFLSSVDKNYINLQLELMKYGPVYTGIKSLPMDFVNYVEGVYYVQPKFSNEISDAVHGIKIIGWGTENGVPYWLCANSWGKDWGKLGGFVKIRRGTNELGIENIVMAPSMGTRKTKPNIDRDRDSDMDPSAAHVLYKQRFTAATAVTVSCLLLNYNF